ncbi:unnamed protein product [Rotaria sordida]|uniref:Nuclear receptor domain-containing protein n=1 Tax=Rotaria sordida TaxID=392033 RepID=A0A819ZA27_9BILA|nr:unnamed protein product [Rotaria sordida]CAF4160459.1 unnamed protein product [Rotaria sordida]
MSVKTKKSKIFPHECEICGAPAEYSFFGVISCYPCKMFFKRNANVGQAAFICNFDGQCKINRYNRHICPACRLATCFKCGMSTHKFRESRKIKPKRNILVKVQVQNQPEKLPTLNLLQSDQSLLTTNQWTLLTNLFHCYKESRILPFSQRLIDIYDASQSNYVIYKELVEEFLVSLYETAGTYLRSNDDLRKLSSDDRSIILRNAADNVCCMSGTFIMQYSYLYNLDAFLNTMRIKYGKRTMDIHVWARKFIDPDIVLAKLSLSLFAFSENTCCYYSNISNDLTNPINILEIQNKYAEVIWKYLLYKYGHYDAVKRYLNIILWLISMSILTFHAQTLKIHMNDLYSLIEQTELTLILDDVDQIIETNQYD